MGRAGRKIGGFFKNVIGGVVEGIADGGMGGGNVLGAIAENIVGGGGSNGNRSRAGPTLNGGTSGIGELVPADFEFYGDTNYDQIDFANAIDTPLPDDDMGETEWNDPWDPRPDINPRPNQRPRPNDTGAIGPTVPIENQIWGPNSFGNGGNTMYDSPIGPPNNPNYTGGSGGCSCTRRKYTCEEKCAYNAQMKAQCKGCKSYFRKTKNYIYPKRRRYTRKPRYTRRKRSYRRKAQNRRF